MAAGHRADRAALVCRPGPAMTAGMAAATERALGADQSNRRVLDDAVLLKAYRRLHAGLNPELELVAFLSEEVGFPAVPPPRGLRRARLGARGLTTIAVAQAFIADGADLYESLAEALVAWLLAPGEVSLEFATEVAADVGRSPPVSTSRSRPARTSPSWRHATRPAPSPRLGDGRPAHLDEAIAATQRRHAGAAARPRAADCRVVHGLRRAVVRAARHPGARRPASQPGPRRARRLSRRRLRGRPARPDRRAAGPPLAAPGRRVMLLSLDHVAGSARRRAEEQNGGPLEQPGLDLAGWVPRARERFLGAYRDGLREAGEPSAIDARSSGPSRSTRRPPSSRTPRCTCRRGCGRRPRGSAGCSARTTADGQPPSAARTSPTRSMVSWSNGERNTTMTSLDADPAVAVDVLGHLARAAAHRQTPVAAVGALASARSWMPR